MRDYLLEVLVGGQMHEQTRENSGDVWLRFHSPCSANKPRQHELVRTQNQLAGNIAAWAADAAPVAGNVNRLVVVIM